MSLFWRRSIGAFLFVILLLVAVFFINPYDLLTRESERFSDEAFDGFHRGQPVSDAVAALGEPIRVETAAACDNCKIFLFKGDYPSWVFGGTECWYLVDEFGLIKEKVRVREP